MMHSRVILRLDGASIKNIGQKAKNTYRCSKFPLNKNFKLSLDQNVTEQTYPEMSCRSQNCSVQSVNQQFYLVNWILFSNVSTNCSLKILS